MSPSTSSSSSSFNKFTYDVFLNFRGKDTRHGFTGHLYKALLDKGFRIFFDDQELRRGEEITPALVKAIQESRIAITVFSENYASSPFCLDELVKIMEGFKEQGRSVLPVFYDVKPCDLRHDKGSYAQLAHGRFKDDKEKERKWREALHQAANLSGDDFKLGNEYEYVFIEKITKEVSKIIIRIPFQVAKYPVGLDSRVEEVDSLLKDGPNDGAHMVGIFGIGGIGKSTLARATYNNLIANQSEFDSCCFLEDVRADSVKYGLKYLQKTLLSRLLGDDNNIKFEGSYEGISIIKKRLHKKKVLLVLDNVDDLKQLEAIAGAPDWFGPGSRVIITTRGQDLLINHEIKTIYEVKGLDEKEARELFIWNAFKNDKVDPDFTKVINQAITYASGLPLALEVIGSNLFRKKIKLWESALAQYKTIPHEKIQEVLQMSFDALEEAHRKIFLDIACCFKGFKLEEVEEILHAHYGINMDHGINMLIEKSLMKIDEHGRVTLHDLIQDMGRAIVRQESQGTLDKCSRLGLRQEILEVLKKDTWTDKIEMINMVFPYRFCEEIVRKDEFDEEIKWNLPREIEWNMTRAFEKMQNLKTLIISSWYDFCPKDVQHLPNSLRVLSWEDYPSASLPPDFHPEELAILDLRRGRLESLQWGWGPKESLNMRVLNLDGSLLKQIPDLSGLRYLEKLSFTSCGNLTEIDESVGFLPKLRILDALFCTRLKSFPPLKLPSLEKFGLSFCTSLEKFPEILGKMKNVTELTLFMLTSIKELPYSIRNLSQLQRIIIHGCGSFKFTSGIFTLQELDHLDIILQGGNLLLPNQDEGDDEQVSSMLSSNATRLVFGNCNMPPEFLQTVIPRFPNLRQLTLQSTSLTILPACMKECRFLKELTLFDCKGLEEISGILPNIESLYATFCPSLGSSTRRKLLNKEWHEEGGGVKMITLPGIEIPEWFEHQSREPSISFWFRNKFPAISLCWCFKIWRDEGLYFFPELIINDKKVSLLGQKTFYTGNNHICIYDRIHTAFEDYADEMLSKNEWNRVVFSPTLADYDRNPIYWVRVQIGVHIIKERSSMDDIRFTDPLLHKEEHRSVNMGDSQSHKEFMQQQQQANLASSSEPREGQGTESLPLHPPPTLNDNDVNWGSRSKPARRATTFTGQGLQEERNSTSINQYMLEGCESIDQACNNNVVEDNGSNPLTELLSTTKYLKTQSLREGRKSHKHLSRQLKSLGLPSLCSLPTMLLLAFA